MLKYDLEDIFSPDRTHPNDAHSILMRLIPRDAHVLELGCATGYLSGYMEQSLNCQVTGLEYDADAVAIARTRCTAAHQVDLDLPDALAPARSNQPYDVLLAAAVLEHLKYPEHLLQKAHGLLKPGALVIVSLPNIAHWQVRTKLLMGRFDYEDYGIMDRTHLHMYTVKTGQALLEQPGYSVENLYIAGSGLQNLLNTFMRRIQRPLPANIFPELLAYELIYVACRA